MMILASESYTILLKLLALFIKWAYHFKKSFIIQLCILSNHYGV